MSHVTAQRQIRGGTKCAMQGVKEVMFAWTRLFFEEMGQVSNY